MAQEDEQRAADLSRQYWESDTSVAEITDQFDISRRQLYQMLRPLPAGSECAECGAGMVYANRSARAAGEAHCPNCGVGEDAKRVAGAAGGQRRGATARAGGPSRRARPTLMDGDPELEQELAASAASPIDTEGALLRARFVLLGGAALAGLAIGAVVALMASRRD